MIEHIHAEGRKVAALCGSPYQARKHADAGVDIIIAQGGEGGGHSGEVGRSCCGRRSSRRSRRSRCSPRAASAAAQQIAAALGALVRRARGPGSQWLMVEEAENTPVQQAAYVKAGQPRHRAQPLVHRQAGRMLRNDWTDAWEDPDNPEAARNAAAVHGVGHRRGRDAQVPRTRPSTSRSTRSVRWSVSSTKVEKTSAVIERWVQEYLEATNTLDELNEAASV